MPLQYQSINLPFGFGMDEATHAFVLERPMLQLLGNARIDKTGSISKRKGWAPEGFYAGQNGSRLVSLPDRLGVINRQTSAVPLKFALYDSSATALQAWDQTGPGGTQSLSEIYVTGRETLSHDTWNFDDGVSPSVYAQPRPDMGYEPTNNVVVYCWEQVAGIEPQNRRIYASVLDATTRQPLLPLTDISGAAVSAGVIEATRSRVVRQGTNLYVVFGTTNGTGSIWAAKFDCTAKTWGPATLLVNDWDKGTLDVYEFFGDENSAWFFSYTNAGTKIHLVKMNGFTALATNLYNTGGATIGAHCIFPQSGGTVWVAWYETTPAVAYAGFDTSLGIQTFASQSIEFGNDADLVGVEEVLQIGIAPTNDVTKVGVFWTSGARRRTIAAPATFSRPISKFCRVTTGRVVSGISRRLSLEMITRPWHAPNGIIYSNYVYNGGIFSAEGFDEFQAPSRGFATAYTIAVIDNTTLQLSGINDFLPAAWRCAATWAIGEAMSRNDPGANAGVFKDMGFNAGFRPVGADPFGRIQIEFPLQSFIPTGTAAGNAALIDGRPSVSACHMTIDDDNDVPVYATTIGQNVVFSGGTPSIYDGQNVTEYGFLWPPENVVIKNDPTGTGGLAVGDYIVSATWRYRHATGDISESIPVVCRPASSAGVITTDAKKMIDVTSPNMSLTKKYNDVATDATQLSETAFGFNLQMYRSTVFGSSLYSEGDAKQNAAWPNDPYRIGNSDGGSPVMQPILQQADSFAQAQENLYTTDGILPNYPPPSLTHICTHRGRVFGISAENPRELRFTHIYEPGGLPGWHPDLALMVPEKAYALASLDEKLIVFCDKSIYVISGTGPDKKGLNSDYTEPQRLNAPHGTTNPDTLASFPDGLFFETNEIGSTGPPSIYLLDRKLNVTRIGGPIEDALQTFRYCHGSAVDFVNERIYWAFCDAPLKRNVTQGLTAVYDWRHKAWMLDIVTSVGEGGAPFTTELVGLGILNGLLYSTLPIDAHIYRHSGSADPSGAYVSTVILTSWLPLAQLQGFTRYRWLEIFLQRIEAHQVGIQIFTDYNFGSSQNVAFSDAAMAPLDHQNLKIHIARQRATAMAIQITDAADGSSGPTQGFTILGMAIEAGMKAPLEKRPQAAMKG